MKIFCIVSVVFLTIFNVILVIKYTLLYKKYRTQRFILDHTIHLSEYHNRYNQYINDAKYLLHHCIHTLNILAINYKEYNESDFIDTIIEQLKSLYSLRDMSSSSFELDHMLLCLKEKLDEENIQLIYQIYPFQLNNEQLYHSILCIYYIIINLIQQNHTLSSIHLYIKQNEHYIHCCIKINDQCHLTYNTIQALKDIIKRYDGSIISNHNKISLLLKH